METEHNLSNASPAYDAQWLRRVFLSTWACIGLLWLPILIGVLYPQSRTPYWMRVGLALLVAAVLAIPHAAILDQLRRKNWAGSLGRAAGTGSVVFLLVSLFLWAQLESSHARTLGWWIGLACLLLIWASQVALVTMAVRTYFAAGREKGSWKALVGGLFIGGILPILVFLIFAKGSMGLLTFD